MTAVAEAPDTDETPEPDERNWAAELRAVIDAHTAGGPYIPAVAADQIVTKLLATDPELLYGWLLAQASEFVRTAINRRDHSRRAFAGRHAKAGAFGAAAAAVSETGDTTHLTKFLDAPYSVESGERKRLGDLTRADLQYVEKDYRGRANENLMRAAFFAALAKKVRRGTVSDHFDEHQIAAMYDSISTAA